MWKQIKVPNLDPVIRQGNKILYDWLGWCLAYVQTAFGAGWSGSTAWDGWSTKTAGRHADRSIPSGVYVPIWFDGYWNGQRLGHVAIYKDGVVYSSPYSHKPYADKLGSIAEVERIYGMKFVGWSEFVGPARVIEWVNNNATADQIRSLYLEILERPADEGGLNNYLKHSYDFVRNALLTSPERNQLLARKEQERKAREAEAIRAAEAVKEAERQRIAEQERLAREQREREAAEKLAAEKAAQEKAVDVVVPPKQEPKEVEMPDKVEVIQNERNGVVVIEEPTLPEGAPAEVKAAVVSGSKVVARFTTQAATVFTVVLGLSQLISGYTQMKIGLDVIGWATVTGTALLMAYNQVAYKLKQAGVEKKGLFAWFF